MRLSPTQFVIFFFGSLAVGANADSDPFSSSAELSPEQEVHIPVMGLVQSASARVRFARDLSRVFIALKVKGGDNVVAAHLHCGIAGANGPIAIGLFSPGPLAFDGGQAKGILTNADMGGDGCEAVIGRPISNIASLAMAIRAGLIYVNVHTIDNPPGEVRGQLINHH